jgi:hypothetical protein
MSIVDRVNSRSWMPTTARYVFWPALLVWSWLLVKPQPFLEIAKLISSFSEFLLFLTAKTLHFSVYAGLLVLAWLSVQKRWRGWMLALLLAHGPLSELGQYYGNLWYNTNRGGCLRDVFIDWFGVALGVGVWLLARRGWTSKSSTNHTIQTEGD